MERRKERERKKHWLVASCMHPVQGPNLQPRCVPWPGIEPATFHIVDNAQPIEPHTGQGCFSFQCILLNYWEEKVLI